MVRNLNNKKSSATVVDLNRYSRKTNEAIFIKLKAHETGTFSLRNVTGICLILLHQTPNLMSFNGSVEVNLLSFTLNV